MNAGRHRHQRAQHHCGKSRQGRNGRAYVVRVQHHGAGRIQAPGCIVLIGQPIGQLRGVIMGVTAPLVRVDFSDLHAGRDHRHQQ